MVIIEYRFVNLQIETLSIEAVSLTGTFTNKHLSFIPGIPGHPGVHDERDFKGFSNNAALVAYRLKNVGKKCFILYEFFLF